MGAITFLPSGAASQPVEKPKLAVGPTFQSVILGPPVGVDPDEHREKSCPTYFFSGLREDVYDAVDHGVDEAETGHLHAVSGGIERDLSEYRITIAPPNV